MDGKSLRRQGRCPARQRQWRLAWGPTRVALMGGAFAAAIVLSLSAPLFAISAFASGIIPPNNPSSNIPLASSNNSACWTTITSPPASNSNPYFEPEPSNPDCVSYWEYNIDAARSQEGVGEIQVPSNWAALTPAERVFVLTNLERTSRGIPPYVGLSSTLNQVALTAAQNDTDPVLQASYPGIQVAANNSGEWQGYYSETGIWAGGAGTSFSADYAWMYEDGWGGSTSNTSNLDCTSATAPGCWGHRDAILGAYTNTNCTDCIAGAAVVMTGPNSSDPVETGSFAALFVRPSSATPNPPLVFTWAQEEPYLGDSSAQPGSSVNNEDPAADPPPTTPPTPVTGLAYTAVTPTRVCDTRPGNPSNLSGPYAQCNGTFDQGKTLGPGATLQVQVAGTGYPVPSNATSVVMTVTVTGTTSPGFLTVYPSGAPRPMASSLNWNAGETVANLVTSAIGTSNGSISIYNSAGDTNVIVDEEGFFASPSSGTQGRFVSVTPEDICNTSDTASINQCTGELPWPSSSMSIHVLGSAGIPQSGVSAVALSVSVTNPDQGGYLTVYQQGSPLPTASNLNYSSGQDVTNSVVVPVGANGSIEIYTSGGFPNLQVDATGWFSASGASLPSDASLFSAISPWRICDTREGNPSKLTGNSALCQGKAPGAQGSLSIQVAGTDFSGLQVPADATGIFANVTVTGSTSGGYMVVVGAGSASLSARSVSWQAGSTVASGVFSGLGSNGDVNIINGPARTDVIVDLGGWFIPVQ
jgi:hypothetical protein